MELTPLDVRIIDTPYPICVDLDNTLIQGDLTQMAFWRLVKNPLHWPRIIMRVIKGGRPALKAYLALHVPLQISNLKFNTKLIEFLKKQHQKGSEIFLVTGSPKVYADIIASHLMVFKEVWASTHSLNLVGKKKAQLLTQKFGYLAYTYIGDSKKDFYVWEQARCIFAVNPTHSIECRIRKLSKNFVLWRE